MQAIRVEGGLVKTILEIVFELCQLLASPPHGRLVLKTILEIAGLHWCSSYPHGGWVSEDNHEVVAEPATACRLSSRKVGCEDRP